MNKGVIVHVSEVNISQESGMGRVEYFWKYAFEESGYDFLHIGPNEVGEVMHKSLFPLRAYQYFKSLNLNPVCFIVHEPSSGCFVGKNVPCFLESHGIERRHWELQLNGLLPVDGERLSLKTKLLFPIWRLYNCDKGLKHAHRLLLINSEDAAYVKSRYNRRDKDIFCFKNGTNIIPVKPGLPILEFTILFNGSWVERKGIFTLIQASELLYSRGLHIQYLLIGTCKDTKTVLLDWPDHLRPFVKVISRFTNDDESKYIASSSLFVLPSYFEGQPLSLLQAMAAGKCCVTTDTCGQKDLIRNQHNGFLFKVGDFHGLAYLLEYCYNNRGVMEELGEKARESVESRTWHKVSREVVDFITDSI